MIYPLIQPSEPAQVITDMQTTAAIYYYKRKGHILRERFANSTLSRQISNPV